MHVALISSDCAPNPGGIASHVYNLAVALRARGAEVTVIGGCRDARLLSSFEPPFPGFQVRHIGTVPRVATAAFAVWARMRLREVMKRSPVDVAHTHYIPADPVALLGLGGRMRRVATNHTSAFLDDYDLQRRRRIYPFLLGRYDAIIAPSRELEERSTYLGVPRERIHYIPNGVDLDRFSPGEAGPGEWERIAPFGREHRIVLATRRLARKNGLRILLRAIPSILEGCPKARFVLAGDGPDRRALEAEARARSLHRHVLFLGNVPNERLPGLYRLADVCVLPSLQEATSVSGLEAMASSKPLVGTRVGGIPEILEDGVTGLIVSPADPQDLARGIGQVLEDRTLAATMGGKARERAGRLFGWPSIAERTIAVYEACLRARKE